MKLGHICRDTRGTTAVEFAFTAPIFFALVFGIIQGGSLLWTQVGLQHGTEMAARCAALNDTTLCGTTASSIKSYAAQEAFGLNLSPSIFSVSTPACGYQISASYAFQFVTTYFGTPSLTLSAQSCFPKS
jgi:Flp pilus assembly protein TadG